ncbi:formate dehydrogenase accessory sulfurtransferase FdhD [Roseomonas sp. GC11]|uniref:formate dehydrogenase accessory sulfurtransferase FdhD n=1 Tax=Roseomonas sp. GC11 TaxID=2950546 RepID=UPI00210BE60D|nr:formate dehydrogenase accessory sulfurtransferase FdhD [Roseomonas sp. GC11]MCQ4162601.1 formate dehydrogenase accessory sulfurtransferase FdhD [Roseomonas sp. GC11]
MRWRAGEPPQPVESLLPEETPVAMTYGQASHAVMMATPRDLEDFALGFSLTEGIIQHPGQLAGLEVVHRAAGVELRMELAEDRQDALLRRRRHMAGPVGCGLCGLESLEAALRPLPPLPEDGPEDGLRLPAAAVMQALDALAEGQALHRATQAVHAAGFWLPGEGMVAMREDVGRHNALDKLVGALAAARVKAGGMKAGSVKAGRGAVVLTSRVSVEMVQKAAILGAPVLIAVSAPSALALRSAEACGMTLIARARGGKFDIYCHARRVI